METIHTIAVHRFSVTDLGDLDNDHNLAILAWKRSAKGQFILEHTVSPVTLKHWKNPYTYDTDYIIIAELEKTKLSEYYLRFDTKS